MSALSWFRVNVQKYCGGDSELSDRCGFFLLFFTLARSLARVFSGSTRLSHYRARTRGTSGEIKLPEPKKNKIATEAKNSKDNLKITLCRELWISHITEALLYSSTVRRFYLHMKNNKIMASFALRTARSMKKTDPPTLPPHSRLGRIDSVGDFAPSSRDVPSNV